MTRNELTKRVYTIQVLKELGVTLAAVNFIFVKDELNTIEFNSYKYGITKYSLSENKFYGNLWESENEAKAVSDLNYHYTSIGLGSVATNNDLDLKILNTVLEAITDIDLNRIIEKAIDEKQNTEKEVEVYFNDKCF